MNRHSVPAPKAVLDKKVIRQSRMNSQLRAVLLIVFGFSVAVAVSLHLVSAYIAAVYQEYQHRKSN